jgi:hypothetical protein
MGRWGDGIYESDSALDAFAITISDFLEREFIYLLFSGKPAHPSRWIREVLSIIEVILLLEQNGIGSDTHVGNRSLIQQAREMFFQIYDGEWQTVDYHSYQFDDLLYRKQHRAAISQMFDVLEKISEFRNDIHLDRDQLHTEYLPPTYKVPLLSIHTWFNRDNKPVSSITEFIGNLTGHLAREIIYDLSPENRNFAVDLNVERVWIYVDVLGFICEVYEISPGYHQTIVGNWRETTIQIWREFLADEDGDSLDENDPLFKNVMAVFDRLEAVARKYPAYEW